MAVLPQSLPTRFPRPAPATVLAVAGAVLLPWSAVLARTLPAVYPARHWALAWTGLDVALAVGALLTAHLHRSHDHRTPVVAAATGTAALLDLWFDVLTAAPGPDLTQALLCAGVELAFAAYCGSVAVRATTWSATAAVPQVDGKARAPTTPGVVRSGP